MSGRFSRPIRDALVEYVQHQAEWRRWKAEEYPEDERNTRSATGLDDLADYLKALPFDDERVLQLEAWVDDYNTGVIQPGPDTAREIRRFRFKEPNQSKEAFLDSVVDALVRDQVEVIEEDTE